MSQKPIIERVKNWATALVAVGVLTTMAGAAVQKAAVYLSLPERLDRLEKGVVEIKSDVKTILRLVSK